MVTVLIVVFVALLAIGIKVRRGRFFWWTHKKDAPVTPADAPGGNDLR
jgi:hypothetical protein